MTRRLKGLACVVGLTMLAAGCAAGQAYHQGDDAVRAGNLDEAVAAYRKAVQAAPDNTQYRIALERTMLAASRAHLDKARDFEQKDQLDAAISEYRLAAEYDPSNRLASAKVATLDRMIRERIESSRPTPAIQQLRERARAASAEPILNPASREPLVVRFNNASLRDVLSAISGMTGINVTYDREVQDRAITVSLEGVTLEQALNQIMTMNQLSYKVVSDRSIFVFPDNAQKHAQYDEQVVRTFYISHADPTEMSQLLSTIIRLPGIAVQPAIAVNRTTNTVTVRGTSSVVQILERIIAQNDKPRAEIVVDVEILEVDRNRVKTYGLNLSEYAIGGIFSPEVSPSGATTPTTPAAPGVTPGGTPTTTATTGTTTTTATGQSTNPTGIRSPPPFNLNTISRGLTTADFYLAVPTAIVRFLESDSRTRVIAKPQLRGAEGTKISLNLGQEIPVVSTSYTPIATGGAGVNPLSSYQYRPVGVNIDMTPRVSLEGDVILDMTLDDSAQGPDVGVAGVTVPSFISRKVTTRLRLRDGESNLLAGLMQETERNSVSGFPGAIHVPLFRQLLSSNNKTNDQIEIVMLLTPHIVRTQELTESDLRPIYIGSQQNLGVGGPPPLIAPIPPAEQPAAQLPPPAGQQPLITSPTGEPLRGPGGTTIAPPPGTTPIPGTVAVPPAPPTPAPTTPPLPVTEPPATPPTATPTPATPTPATPTTATPTPAQPPPTPTTPETVPQPPPTTEPPITSPGIGAARVLMSPSGTTFRVGGGPYIIPISISEAARISTITLTLTFDSTKLRVRTVQEGSFMRAGGASVAFNQQVSTNRVDITLSRGADATGASGTGLLAAILFDAIAPGTVTVTLSGAATGPGGTAMGLQFRPVTITVQ
jgi:general secretion pathway protein D